MSESKHTPGPWNTVDSNVESKPGGPNVAIAYDPNDHMHVNKTCRANARLIAAAPELLAALTLLTDIYRAKSTGHHHPTRWESAWKQSYAAIRKATGQE